MPQTENKNKKTPAENKNKANRIIRFRTLMASGVGFIPFPILDMAGILSIQLWMIRDISKVYDVPFKKNVAKSIIGTLLGNVGTVGIVKFIPGINILGGGAVAVSAGAATYALGKVFMQHFDQGGTLLSFDPIKSRAYFEQVYEESKITVTELQQQEDSFKNTDTQALASVAVLKKANSELMETINNLEKQLKESKKERAAAIAVAKTQTQVQNILPAPTKKKRRWFDWLWRALLLLTLIALLIFTLFQFNIIGNVKSEDINKEEATSVVEENDVNKKNTIISNNKNIIDSMVINNQTDSLRSTILNDTITQNPSSN